MAEQSRSVLSKIRDALLGVSAYERIPIEYGLTGEQERKLRENLGGNLAPLPVTQTRWYLSDLETAEIIADRGDMSQAARLMRTARRDGVYSGVLSTRTDGLVALPKRFRGAEAIVKALSTITGSARSIFDEIFPPSELALLAKDGLELGVGVAELVPVKGRDYPVMIRLEPEFLIYRWYQNAWFYRSVAGLIPITPGDGRWILHMPGGRVAPWNSGTWRAIGRAYIRKDHASNHKDNWEGKLANPARVAVSPQGASEAHKQSWFRKVMAWGVNSVFGVTPGYDVKLLESNGRGWDSFNKTIADQNNEMIIQVAGQTVTTDGGAGFQNSDIHKSIRSDLIAKTASDLSHTINTQGLPDFIVRRWGLGALANPIVVEWDVTPPKDRSAEATSLVQAANAIKQLSEALAPHGLGVDIVAMCTRFGIETIPHAENTRPALSLAPDDVAKVVRVDEARASQGLPPIGDERGQMTIVELEGESKDSNNENSTGGGGAAAPGAVSVPKLREAA